MGLVLGCPCCAQGDEQNDEPLLRHGQSYSSLGSLGNVGPAGFVKGDATDTFTEDRARSTYGRVFGTPLATLNHDDDLIPVIVDKMITAIEGTGMRDEGLYRKSGLMKDVRELINDCNDDLDSVDFSKRHIHVLATVFKTFFRDLPEPLLCYDLYDEFLEAASKPVEEERCLRVSEIRKRLPEQNARILRKLLCHLAKVAEVAGNRMTAHALAIIFAPNILQPFKSPPPNEMISNVNKQTACIECMIEERINIQREYGELEAKVNALCD